MADQPEPTPRNAGRAEALALAVARGESVAGAAQRLEIPTRTAYAWSKTRRFKRRVARIRRTLTDRAVGALTASAVAAVATLMKEMKGGDSGANRIAAARTLLDQYVRFRSAAELEARIEHLEAAVGRGADGDARDGDQDAD